MKAKISLWSMLLFLGCLCTVHARENEKKIVVIIPSYNNKEWYQRNLDSVFSQNYENYQVIYIDDVSRDGTGDYVEQYVQCKEQVERVTLIKNKKRQGALANLYRAIHSCDDHAIVVTLDGDDWFAHDNVLSYINKIYEDPNIWLTYGQYEDYPRGTTGCCKEIPQDIIAQNSFREHTWVASHLRTFHAWLFKQVKLEDLLYKGSFFPMTWDMAFMLPMLEMAGGNFAFIPEVLYQYNNLNPISDSKVNVVLQEHLDKFIRAKQAYKSIKPEEIIWKDSNMSATADLVIFSLDRPLQLYALLESVENYVQGLQDVYVVYRTRDDAYEQAYEDVARYFEWATFVKQSNNHRDDFKPLTLQCVFDSPSEYVLFAGDDDIVTDYIDINQCIQAMRQTDAYAFYLRLGKNLSWCYTMDCEQKVPVNLRIKDDIYAWQFSRGECDWNYPNNIDMTIYRKADIRQRLENMNYSSPNVFEWHWAIGVDFDKVGLFYKHSKIVNIPLNVVQKDEPDNIHMSLYSTENLLDTFNAPLKMDINPLFCINNISAHMEYIPTFVPR